MTTTNAKLEVMDAKKFTQALEKHNEELTLLIEWTLEKPQLCSVSSGAEASRIFTESFKKDPEHLHFRAFSKRVEYAWFGTVGVRVELPPEGDLVVEEQNYYAKGLEGGGDAQVRVQRLMCNGRAIYEKLLKVHHPPSVLK